MNNQKTIQFNKILTIIKSCKTVTHVQNTEVILHNFFKLHKDLDLFSTLRIELYLKLCEVSNKLYLCTQKMEIKTINLMKSVRSLFKLNNYKYIAAKN